MKKFSLLGKSDYQLTPNLKVHIPLLSELRNNIEIEQGYYSLISVLIKTPCDAMVELDDMGLDYTQVKEYQLFIMSMFGLLQKHESINQDYWKLILPEISLNDLIIIPKDENNLVVANKLGEVIIDENIFFDLTDLLRQIINVEKNMKFYKVPEIETRKYIIEQERKKLKRKLEREQKQPAKTESFLDGIILFCVTTAGFDYNFKTINEITLYDLYAAYRQIMKNDEINGLMSGYWSGNVDLTKIPEEKLTRIIL